MITVIFSKCFSFCSRWVEDLAVANRLKEIWPNIAKAINYWELLPKSCRPSSKSYDNVVKGVKDDLIVAKLSFFSFLASTLQLYLKYQTYKLMVPFLSKYLEALYKNLMCLVLKPDAFFSKYLEALCKNLMWLVLKPDAFDSLSGNDLLHVNLMNKSTSQKERYPLRF